MLTASLSPFEIEAMLLSLKVGIWSTIGLLPIAVTLAWLLARHEFYGKTLVDALLHLPLVLPPVSIGFILLILFGRQGWLGKPLADWLGITVMFKWEGAAIASAVMALPLTVGAIRLSIAAVDRKLEAAARSLGASRLDVFFSVTLPIAFPGLIAGAILGFARSLGEFGATITFVSTIPGETETLPLAMYRALQSPQGDTQALRLTLIAVVIALAALLGANVLNRWATARSGH
ncbi:molybdate ABC transporter permease subunit [Dongia sp.]|uniref:molybdate ABC transporter permease subunit n=1 Tax=Dongia sp. TaxID=1977262 RepID=UPI003752FBF9